MAQGKTAGKTQASKAKWAQGGKEKRGKGNGKQSKTGRRRAGGRERSRTRTQRVEAGGPPRRRAIEPRHEGTAPGHASLVSKLRVGLGRSQSPDLKKDLHLQGAWGA